VHETRRRESQEGQCFAVPALKIRQFGQDFFLPTLAAADDLGYRIALAAAASLPGADREGTAAENGDAVEAEPASTEDSSASAEREDMSDPDAPDTSDAARRQKKTGSGMAAVDWTGWASRGEDHEHATADRATKKAPLLRILPHATVGTLGDRIRYHFDLPRFDVDVIICRKGGPRPSVDEERRAALEARGGDMMFRGARAARAYWG
jgi:hypothetical protein